MCEIPVEVDDSEVIVRAVCHPYHLDKEGRLAWVAYQPPPEDDRVSVLRHDYLGGDACKKKGQELSGGRKTYAGLAFAKAEGIRQAEVRVIDSREEFIGHADIVHQQRMPARHMKLEPAQLKALRDTCLKIVGRAIYVSDPEPASDSWSCGCPNFEARG